MPTWRRDARVWWWIQMNGTKKRQAMASTILGRASHPHWLTRNGVCWSNLEWSWDPWVCYVHWWHGDCDHICLLKWLLLVSKTLQHNTCWSLSQRTNSFAYINWFNILQISSTICSSLISMFCCKTLGLRLSILDGDIISCTPFKHLTSLSDQQKLPSHNFTGAKTAMVLRVHQTASISYIWIYLDLRQAKYITV